MYVQCVILLCISSVLGEVGEVLTPGYPGYVQTQFGGPRQAEGRALHYRHTPEVDRLQSPVHELYMRPYNYVSYQMGGTQGKSQYQYQYHTTHPQYSFQHLKGFTYHTSKPGSYKASDPTKILFSPNTYQFSKPAPTILPATKIYETPKPVSILSTPKPYQTPKPSITVFNSNSYQTPKPMPTPSTSKPYQVSDSAPTITTPITYQTTYLPKFHSAPDPPNPIYLFKPYTYHSTPTPAPTTAPTPAPAMTDSAAVAVLVGDKVSGIITFSQTGGPTSPVHVYGNLTGLSPGKHGFHIHQYGDTTQGCKSMGGHYNPLQLRHGAPSDHYRHIGDLGNIVADIQGEARIDIMDTQLSLNGLSSIIGRGVVIHSGEDDLGKGGDSGSLKTGNAGSRVSCGVIARTMVPSV